jgi:hypothetical protein
MAARDDVAQLPVALVRWLLTPGAGTGVFTAFFAKVQERLHRISVPRMSDEWLRNYERNSHDPEP